MIIRDGRGKGYKAGVNKHLQLETAAISQPIQHWISRRQERAFQVIGEATLAAGTVIALHIRNDATDKFLVVTYIRHQVVGNSGGTAIPNLSNYFRVAFGRTYDTGGSVATPVNVHVGSGVPAEVTAYQGDPTLTGTAVQVDKWYTKAEADMNVFVKEGAILLAPGKTLELSYVGDQTAGLLYTRTSFLMWEFDE